MKNKPLVSGIIIFLNAEKFIQEAIESVFAQTYDNWELLLVDDGSTDNSTQIALRYAEQHPEKVCYLEHPGHQNRGMPASRNLGFSRAKGEYIALLDSDDVWLPHKLQQQVAILDSHPEAGMVYGLSQYWHSWTGKPEDTQRDFVPKLKVQANKLYKPPTLLTLLYPLGNATPPCPSDLLLRREMVVRVGGFEEAFKGIYHLYEDQAFLTKVYLKEPVFVASECWDRYRQHPEQCVAVVHGAGQYHSVRLYFLNWLAEYLSEQGVKDTGIWKLLEEAQLQTHIQLQTPIEQVVEHLQKQGVEGIEIWKLLQEAQLQVHSKQLKKLERALEKERRELRRLTSKQPKKLEQLEHALEKERRELRRLRQRNRQLRLRIRDMNRQAQSGLNFRIRSLFKRIGRLQARVLGR